MDHHVGDRTPGGSDGTDPALLALLRAVEQGQHAPTGICLVVGGWLVQGELSHQSIAQVSGQVWRQELEASRDFRRFRGSSHEREAAARDVIDPLVAAITPPGAAEPSSSMTLVNAVVGGGVGAAFNFPTLRVPVAAVQAWTVTGFSVTQAGGGSAGGVSFSF